jgi:PAS domain S-box-containing protein
MSEIGKILIIEDDKEMGRILRWILEKSGYEVAQSTNGRKGLEQFHRKRPDVILLDLNLPEMDGFEFLMELKPKDSDPFDIIVITGLGDNEDISRCYELGAGFILRKPFVNAELKQLIKRSLERKRFMLAKQAVVENMPVLMDAFDKNGNIIAWNRECEKVTGYSKSEIIGNPEALKILYPDEGYYRNVIETIKQGADDIYDQEFTLTSKNGELKTVKWSNVSNDFPIPGWASWAVGIDVTEQKKIRQELVNSERYYRTLFDESPIAIWEKDCSDAWKYMDSLDIRTPTQLAERIDSDSEFFDKCASLVKIEKVSKEALSLLNVSLEDFRTNWMNMFSREEHIDNMKRVFRFDENNSSFKKELVMKKTDGKEFNAIMHCSALAFMPSRHPLKILISVIDITAMKKAEQAEELHRKQLMQSDRLATLGTLAAGIAHEINNPNNVVTLNTAVVKEAWADLESFLKERNIDETLKIAGMPIKQAFKNINKALSGMEKSADRISQIIADLKNYARNPVRPGPAKVNINAPLKGALSLLSSLIKDSTDNFRVCYGKNIPEIVGEELRIEQVFVNIIQNACQTLSDRNQALEIRSYFDSGISQVAVEVRDEGTGIEENDLPYIKNPFFTTKKELGGTGLGLTISSKIMEDHNGSMEFVSVPGKGTKATVKLPVNPEFPN